MPLHKPLIKSQNEHQNEKKKVTNSIHLHGIIFNDKESAEAWIPDSLSLNPQ